MYKEHMVILTQSEIDKLIRMMPEKEKVYHNDIVFYRGLNFFLCAVMLFVIPFEHSYLGLFLFAIYNLAYVVVFKFKAAKKRVKQSSLKKV